MKAANSVPSLILILSWIAVNSVYGHEPIAFKKMDMPFKATTMATTPDDNLLLVAHQEENKVTVWNTTTLEQVKEFDCPSPRFILTRGDSAYIANYESGTISVFDKSWNFVNQIRTNLTNLKHLSAPRGRHFENRVIAVGYSNEHRGGCAMIIDLERESHSLLTKESHLHAVTVSHDGRIVLVNERASNETLKVLRLTSNLGEVHRDRLYGKHGHSNLLVQWGTGPYWIGERSIATGVPPQSVLSKDSTHLLVADRNVPVFYILRETEVSAHAISQELTEFGRREVVAPEELERLSSRRRAQLRQSMDNMLYEHFAITRNMQTAFFLLDGESKGIFHAVTTPFDVPVDVVNAAKLPGNIVEGKVFRFKLFGEGIRGVFQVMKGPDGFNISPNGELIWTPTSADVGEHAIKLRAEVNGKTTFPRFAINVVSSELANALDGDLTKLKDAGNFVFENRISTVHNSIDMKSIVVLAGDEFVQLDAGAFTTVRRIRLPRTYKRIAERKDYFVALSDSTVDLLNKDKLETVKSIRIDAGRTVDLALHPTRSTAYVTTFNKGDGRRSSIESKRVVEVNERTGKAVELPRIYGTFVQTDPTGRYLFVALRDRYERGLRIDWNIGRIMPEYGEVDLLLSYDMSGRGLRHLETNVKAGANGSKIVASFDGKHIAYVSGGGTPTYSYAVPAFESGNINSIEASYKIGAYPKDIDFHPALDMVAVANGKECKLFRRSTGEELPDRFKVGALHQRTPISEVHFAPSGNRLILGTGNNLFSVRLNLTSDERADLRKWIPGTPIVSARESVTPRPRNDYVAKLERARLQALDGRAASRKVSAKEIARYYTKSVVQVQGARSAGTGFVIGKDGYILTCAHVLPIAGDPKVTYEVSSGTSTKLVTSRASVVRVDKDKDLALLKIEATIPLRPVQLCVDRDVESAEDVTVIGNPGVGDTILTNTVTTGVVSNARREVDGTDLIQTSAPINPGNSGGPMFNERGQVIGVVVSKARIENTGFAIPVNRVVEFLNVRDDSATVARIWTDVTGKFRIDATLVDAEGGKVRLRRSDDGRIVSVPINQLSDVDRDFLQKNGRGDD